MNSLQVLASQLGLDFLESIGMAKAVASFQTENPFGGSGTKTISYSFKSEISYDSEVELKDIKVSEYNSWVTQISFTVYGTPTRVLIANNIDNEYGPNHRPFNGRAMVPVLFTKAQLIELGF